jgi:hypothetical protein
MRRYTNLALAGLLSIAIATGLIAQAAGTGWGRIAVVAHGTAALGLLTLVPWKSQIIGNGLRRGRGGGRWWSFALAATTLFTVATGITQMSGAVARLGPLTTMQAHIGSAVATAALAMAHFVRHPVRPRRTDLSRRTFLRTAALGISSGVAWFGVEGIATLAGWPGAERRFTGSHEHGSGDPEAMPATQWFTDEIQRIDPDDWVVQVGDLILGSADVAHLPLERVTATLDCTSGWYAEQEWRGVRLDALLDVAAATSIDVRSVTGYSRRFPAGDVSRLWLAFEVGGSQLSPGHGFPARLVAPGRRGFWWVKWVDRVTTSDLPWWLQPPFPLK